jgi:hypothetical protein
VPNVACPTCGLTSYAPRPHNAPSPCPYCDAELFPALRVPRRTGEDEGTEPEAEAA